MKKVLIISPFFPPVNAADMHRVRQSVQYYEDYNWIAEVVVVDPIDVDSYKDENLLLSLPNNLRMHKVPAFKLSFTRKFGLGSIAYRSMFQYWKYVNKLLKKEKFDLILFSTTAYPVTALGRIWKFQHKIPYIIDMQDPWRPDHYLSLPKNQRPPKFWLSYRLDAFFEKFSMKKVDGLMSVSKTYIDILQNRYQRLKQIPYSVIPFAAFKKDIDIAKSIKFVNRFFDEGKDSFNIVYIGRAGHDMEKANTLFLKAIQKGKQSYDKFNSINIYYIGTSYDSSGLGAKTVEPIAIKLNLSDVFKEYTQRIPYYEGLRILSEADFLFVPGSDNEGYTASKIYPYVWFNKPLITLFHSSSSVNLFMNECKVGLSLQFDLEEEDVLIDKMIGYIEQSFSSINQTIDWNEFKKYDAETAAKNHINLFEVVLKNVRQ